MKKLPLRFLSIVLTFTVVFNFILNDLTIRSNQLKASTTATSATSRQSKHDWQVATRNEAVSFKKQLPTKSNRTTTATIITQPTKWLWEDPNNVLPNWMKEYFDWHAQERQKLNESNWQDYHYLLQRCVQADKKCSGASDRLKAIPSVIRMAYSAQPRRLLFLAWSRPAPLEEFLVPPTGGFDWRVPEWLVDKLDVERRGPKFWLDDNQAMEQWPTIADPIVRIKNIRGSEYYDKLRDTEKEPSFAQVYRHVWNVVFEPSPAVAARIHQNLQTLQLQPRRYVAAHVRSLYVSDTRQQGEEEPAVQCATQIVANMSSLTDGKNNQETKAMPIYFASDSSNVTKRALEYGTFRNATIVSRISDVEPIHLDRGRSFLENNNDWKGRKPSEFYDIFVDLFLLASSQCVVYGVGGYGEWAALLSENYSCSINYRNTPCNWTSSR